MATLTTAVDLLQLIGEPTRVRLLALLATHELTVAEIVAVTQLAQSSVSTHLGKLREAGLVRDRKAGPSTFYALNDGAMPAPARKVWELVRGEVRDALLEGDGERASRVLRARERALGLAGRRGGGDGAPLVAGTHVGVARAGDGGARSTRGRRRRGLGRRLGGAAARPSRAQLDVRRPQRAGPLGGPRAPRAARRTSASSRATRRSSPLARRRSTRRSCFTC